MAHQSIVSHTAHTDIPDQSQPAAVWPETWKRTVTGEAYIGGSSISALAEQYGTPLFIYDEADFRRRCRTFAQAFGAENVHYAGKAFLCSQIVRWVREEGLSLDVCSQGELFIALSAGFPAERITLHGNNKTEVELDYAIQAGVGFIVIDSEQEIERVNRIAAQHNTVQKVFIRLTTGVRAQTHEYISTAQEDQKFGFSLASGASRTAVEHILQHTHLALVGLHSHIGSLIYNSEEFIQAATLVSNFARELQQAYAVIVTYIDLGGGIGISYLPSEQTLDIASLAQTLLATIDHSVTGLNSTYESAYTVQVEPGRAISGPAGITVYQIGTIKDIILDNGQQRRYLSVDGGMSDNIRPALYGAKYHAEPVQLHPAEKLISTRIVGKHCESGDILISEIDFPLDIAVGEYIMLAATGAYCYAMSSGYNASLKPAVISVYQGKSQLLMRRETLADLLRLE